MGAANLLTKRLRARLREARKHTGLSRADYAELLSVNVRTIERWEEGTRVPELAMLCRIASMAGVSLFWVLADVEESRHQIAQGE